MIYLPGHPSSTKFVKQLLLISGLIGRSTKIYLTSKHWGMVMAELDAQYMDALVDPDGPVPWHSGGDSFAIGNDPKKLTIINSGTDDQLVVNKLNRDTPGAVDFIERRDYLRVA